MKANTLPSKNITTLSIAQVSGVAITTLAGLGVWFLVATIASTEEVGTIGRIISTSTFIAGIVISGIGQFILSVVRSSTTAQLRRFFLFGLIIGGFLSGLISTFVSVLQTKQFNEIAILAGFLSVGIAITNLQDALYLGTGLPYDIPAKNAVILVTRLILLLGISQVHVSVNSLLIVFVVSQFVPSMIWVIIRGPQGLKRHVQPSFENSVYPRRWSALAISYLYSIAITSVTMGIPAFVTSFTTTTSAGSFFLAWTVAGLLGSISVAVANSVLAISLGPTNIAQRLKQILLGLLTVLCICGFILSILMPYILTFLGKEYTSISSLFRFLAIGQLFFGITVISVAAYRSVMLKRQLFLILISWPIVIFTSVFIGLKYGGSAAAAVGFVIGNILTAVLIYVQTFRMMRRAELDARLRILKPIYP